jgi:hypothetical protein
LRQLRKENFADMCNLSNMELNLMVIIVNTRQLRKVTFAYMCKLFTRELNMIVMFATTRHIHVRSVYERVTYDCDVCDCKATIKGTFNLHVKSVHKGVNTIVRVVTTRQINKRIFSFIRNLSIKCKTTSNEKCHDLQQLELFQIT